MNLLIDEQLSDGVQQDSKGQHMADCRHPASQQFFPLVSVKEQGKNKRRLSRFCVSQAAPHAKQDGNEWLQDEPEAPGSRESPWQVLEKLSGE
jgi:hypothetical protein